MKFEEILPEVRKGRKARRKDFAMVDLDPGDKYLDLNVDDLLADDWELVPEPVRVADYFVPISTAHVAFNTTNSTLYEVQRHTIGQQPEGSVMVPGSEKLLDE